MISLTSQLIALRRLNSVGEDLRMLDKRLNTGVKVADTRDSTSAVSASRASGSRSAAFSSVQSSLDLGIATIATASSAVTTANSLLGNTRDLLQAAKDGNADLAGIQAQLTEQRMKLRSTVTGAAFKSVNLLASSTSASGYLGAPRDATGYAYSIGVDRNRTRLLDTAGASGILQKTFDLTSSVPGGSSPAPSTLGLSGTATQTAGTTSATPALGGLGGAATAVAGLNANPPAATGLSGTATAVAGTASSTPSTNGLSGTTSTVSGAASTAATKAKVAAGTSSGAGFNGGDTINLNVQLNGVTKTVKVYQRNVSSHATLQTELQRAVNAEFGANTIAARVESDNTIHLETVATGAGQSIDITSGSVVDGDDVLTTGLGLAGGNGNWSTVRMNSTDGYYAGGRTYEYFSMGTVNLNGIDRNDSLTFGVWSNHTSGGAQYVDVSVSLAGVTTAAQLASAIETGLANAGRLGSRNVHAALYNGEIRIMHAGEGGIDVVDFQRVNGNGTPTGTLGLSSTGAVTNGANATSAVAASATTGSDFSGPVTLGTGAALNFNLTINGATTAVAMNKTTVENALTGQSGYTAGSGTIADINKLVLVAQRALSDAGIGGVTVSASGNRLRFTKGGTPATGDSVNVSSVTATASTSTAATLTTGSDFSGPRTIAANASLDFTLAVDGVAKAVSVTKADVETALNGRSGYTNGSGTIANVADFARVVQAAMTRQNLSDVTVAAEGNRLKFTKTATGSSTIAISGVAGNSTATNAVATTGSDFTSAITVSNDAAITFDVALDGGAVRTVRIEKSTVEAALEGISGRTAGTGTIANVSEFAMVAQRALSNASVSGIVVGTSNNRLTFTRAAAGAGSVALSNAQALASTATAASLRTGSDFSGPVTVESGATIGFDVGVDGGTTRRVTIRNSTVEAALGGVSGRTSGTGTIADVSQFALVVQQALTEAGVGDVRATADGQRIRLAKTATGAGQVAIGGVSAVAAATTGSSTTIDSINVNSAGFAALGAADRRAILDDYIANVELIARRVGETASYLAFVGKQMEIQSGLTTRLQGIEVSRVSRMVNTDLDADAARRTALEARLALVRKSIEIVNQSRKNVLDIF